MAEVTRRDLFAAGAALALAPVLARATPLILAPGEAPLDRPGRAAATLAGRYVLVTGGGARPTAVAAVLDPRAERWYAVAPMLAARRGHALVALPGGDVVALGGIGAAGRALASVERYSLAADRWEFLAPLPAPDAAPVAVVMDGRLLVGSAAGFVPLLAPATVAP